MDIKDSKDHPYFFGMGLACRYNCNYGFNDAKVIHNNYLSDEVEQKLKDAGYDPKEGITPEMEEIFNKSLLSKLPRDLPHLDIDQKDKQFHSDIYKG